MLSLLLVLALASSSASDPEPVRYRIELVDPAEPLVALHVECVGDADGITELSLAEGWAGLAETGADLALVEAADEAGTLDGERLAPHRWRLRHAPRAALRATFELRPTDHRKVSGPPGYYLPILEPGLFHGIGAQTLPAPEHLAGDEVRPITLAWEGFEGSGWRTVSSFGDARERTTERSLDAFRHALFLAGPADDLALDAREVRGQRLMVAVWGTWRFAPRALADVAQAVVETERAFFDDDGPPFYLISLIPVGGGTAGSSGGGSSWGGTGLTSSFALFMTPDNTLATDAGGGGVTWLLAHELFHEWNGHVITLAQPEQAGYWFSEGFTDFYARRLMSRAGLLTPEQELESWNRRLAEFAGSPERHAPSSRVVEAFWTEPDVGNLPYQRGDVLALWADHAIRAHSGGQHSLDDVMRRLVDRSRAGAGPFTTEALVAALGELAGPEAAAALLAWARDGVEPDFPADVGAPDFRLEAIEVPVFDVGFDLDAAVKAGRLTDVRPDGPAARAGLSEGLRFAGWRGNRGQASEPIEVTVREEGATRSVTYLPQGRTVPGYRLSRR